MNIPWTKRDWNLREALRSAESIKDLFRVYRENCQYILENRPELARFALRVFRQKFYQSFSDLVRAKDATHGLPERDSVWRAIRLSLLDQITIGLS